ncbi:MAG: insulinase family protein, partial [Marinicaulis sp.]|nr:insulinase family protein [Marinicaulis sp.]
HVDRSDPVVAIDLAAHVGSARETEGRTGFAHLFEHLLFLDSENLGYGGLDEMNTRIGGDGTNGFTTHDMTQYFQAVPADALEKVIWAEADKLGFFINTVTQEVVDNEKQVVKNEKRQRVDNQPFGHNFYIINKAIYPEDHPYNWQVIGSLADLDAATLQDVKDFYRRWYVPNNVTVTITGDFDTHEAKRLVEKYFGEIPRGPEVQRREPRPGVLDESKSLYHEDNFATVPQLTMIWPSVEEYHEDANALGILADYLTSGKRAPLNEVLVDEKKLSSSVAAFQYGKELAGEFYIFATANAGEDLDNIKTAIDEGLTRFEENGISQDDLNRIKAGLEVGVYGDLQSALGKAIQLGEYNLFTGDPGYLTKDIENMQAVTTDDVMRVYNKYIKGKNYLATSFVPKGQIDLTLEGATKAEIVEEPIVQGAETEVLFDPTARTFEPTPSSFDRTVEPDFGEPYTLPTQDVWRASLDNGVEIYGIESNETPLVYFSMRIDAGRDRGSIDKPAVAALTADMLEKGTANKTTAELEDAIRSLGSNISISSGQFGAYVSGSTLARNFDETVALAQEMLLEPRWDEDEFELLMIATNNDIDQAAGDPNAIASREAAKRLYPEDNIFSYLAYGSKEKLEGVTIDDLKAFYAENFAPGNATLRVVGAAVEADVKRAFEGIEENWTTPTPAPVTVGQARPIENAAVYFYDVPGAKQSVLRVQRPSLSAVDPDLPMAEAMNFLLGGIYTSQLMTELRVNKGYTYSIRSGFSSAQDRGIYSVRTSVRSNVTKESMETIRDIMRNYGQNFTEEDLAIMKSARLRNQALQTETLSEKLGVLSSIADYGYPNDFLAQNANRIEAMTLDEFKRLAEKYIRPDAMDWIVVGDAETQAARLSELGYGAPVMLEAE